MREARHLTRAWLLVLVLVLGLSGLAIAPAGARKLPPSVGMPHLGVPIPANGSIQLAAAGDPPSGLVVTLIDAAAASVPIVLRQFSSRRWVVTPQQPLTPGATYRLSVGGGAVPFTFDISVTAAWTPSPPIIETRPELQIDWEWRDDSCCRNEFTVPMPSGESLCQPEKVLTSLVSRPNFSSPESLSVLTQYMFGVHDPAVEQDPRNRDGFRTFDELQRQDELTLPRWHEPAEEYCFELDAIEIGSDIAFTYPKLPKSCISHASLGDVSFTPRAFDLAERLPQHVCQFPPKNFVSQWCEFNSSACTAMPGELGCKYFGYLCRGEPDPRPKVEPSMFGFAGAAPSSSSFDTSYSGSRAFQSPRRQDIEASGCQVGGSAGGATHALWLSLLSLGLRRGRARPRQLKPSRASTAPPASARARTRLRPRS